MMVIFLRKQASAVVVLSTLLALQPLGIHAKNKRSRDDLSALSTIAAVAGGVLGAVVTGVAAYKFCDWLCGKSDQEVLQSASEDWQSSKDRYQDVISFAHVHLVYSESNILHSSARVSHISESLLYQISAQTFKGSKQAVDEFISSISATIDRLRSNYNELIKRSNTLRSQGRDAYFAGQMEHRAGATAQLLIPLQAWHELMTYHKAYFVLFGCEASLLRAYDQEIKAFERCGYDRYDQREILRSAVMSHQRAASSYPYKHYIESLQVDITTLEKSLRGTQTYTKRHACARQLLASLQEIKRLVCADPAYTQDIQAYERAQLERQRLELARRQAQAMEEQARQLRNQAHELEWQNALRQQQLWQTTCYEGRCAPDACTCALHPERSGFEFKFFTES